MRETNTLTCQRMDITSCFCGVAAAVFFLTVLWRFKEGCGAGNWPGTFGALGVGGALGGGAALYFTVPPVVCVSAALLGYSLVLICDTERRVELLQSRAVLITGDDTPNTHYMSQVTLVISLSLDYNC